MRAVTKVEWGWMRRAVDLGKQSPPEPDRTSPAPRVGVVVARGPELLGESFRGETGHGNHAEFGLLRRLHDVDLSGAELYTTLEPCSRRGPGKLPCAERITVVGISTVYIGMYDPNPRIYREGWKMLRDAGLVIRDFAPELREEIRSDNSIFVDSFRLAVGNEGFASFDYKQNGGRFTIQSTAGTFNTRWTQRGANSIYAYDSRFHVALARYARQFSEIDDPGALDFSQHSVGVTEGEIVAFRNEQAFILIRIEKVFAGPERGADHYELQFEFQVRVNKTFRS